MRTGVARNAYVQLDAVCRFNGARLGGAEVSESKWWIWVKALATIMLSWEVGR